MTDFPPLPVLDELTEPERDLVEAARRGHSLTVDASIRAEVVRELLLGRRGPLDPRGVRVEGARITGELDLDAVEAITGLGLADCVIPGPVKARHGTLPWLDLSGSKLGAVDLSGARITAFADFARAQFAGGAGIALDAEGLRTDELRLSRIRATGAGRLGAICLLDARVSGWILLNGAEITNADGPAVYLDGLECGALGGGGLRATGTGSMGTVRMLGAHVSQDANFDDAVLTNASGSALNAERLVVGENLSLAAVKATGTGENGTVCLLSARIGGLLNLGVAEFANDSGPAVDAIGVQAAELLLTGTTATAAHDRAAISLNTARIGGRADFGVAVVTNSLGPGLSADGIRVDGSFSAEDMKARGSGGHGALSLLGADVAGDFVLDGAELADDTGVALGGDRLRVGGNAHLRVANATGSGEKGTIRLLTARIAGDLYLDGARIANDAGPALHADRLHVGGSLDLKGAHADGADGAVRLHHAEIAGQLRLGGAELAGAAGPAVSADDLRVGTLLELIGAKLTCSSEFGALSLGAARIDGSVTLADAVVTNDGGPVLFADRCRVRDSVRLTGLRGTGAGDDATIRLLGAHIGGQLNFTGAELAHLEDGTRVSLEDATVDGPIFLPAELVGASGQVVLDGFRFGSLGDVTWHEWLQLIRDHTAAYRPGPYQRLAASERAAGHDGNARQILIAQQRDLQRRAPEAIGGWPARRFHWLWGALAGYGYRARRTAAALLFAVVAAGGLGLWAGHVGDAGHRAAERTSELTAKVGTPCTTVELIGVGLDRGLPLSPGVRGRCDLNTGITAGQWFTVAIWLVQAAIWALATLALVGYTGLVRKTG